MIYLFLFIVLSFGIKAMEEEVEKEKPVLQLFSQKKIIEVWADQQTKDIPEEITTLQAMYAGIKHPEVIQEMEAKPLDVDNEHYLQEIIDGSRYIRLITEGPVYRTYNNEGNLIFLDSAGIEQTTQLIERVSYSDATNVYRVQKQEKQGKSKQWKISELRSLLLQHYIRVVIEDKVEKMESENLIEEYSNFKDWLRDEIHREWKNCSGSIKMVLKNLALRTISHVTVTLKRPKEEQIDALDLFQLSVVSEPIRKQIDTCNKSIGSIGKQYPNLDEKINSLNGKCHFWRWGLGIFAGLGVVYVALKNTFAVQGLTRWAACTAGSIGSIYSVYKTAQACSNEQKRENMKMQIAERIIMNRTKRIC